MSTNLRNFQVNRDDRMPPLICELCVDKVNDFYEFREMCRATNARVRASLGLPPQTMSQDVVSNIYKITLPEGVWLLSSQK